MSAADMMAYSTIEFGLSLKDSCGLTIKKFKKLLKWHIEKTRNRFNERSSLVRLQTFYLLNVQLEKKESIKSPSDLWLLINEKERIVKVPTKEEEKEMVKVLGEKIIVK